MSSTTLILTLGSSPAIVTESLYALAEKGYPPVERIVIISTSHGIDRLNKLLLNTELEQLGGFYRYCRQFNIPFHQIRIEGPSKLEAVRDLDGNILDDINSVKDDETIADVIFEKVKELTSSDSGILVGVLSGGRKTMGTHLSTAFQLFARQQDRLIHVLVNDPFDRIPGFYYPHQEGGLISPPWDKEAVVDPSDASISLIEVQFPRLRGLLPSFFRSTANRRELMQQIDLTLNLAQRDPLQMVYIDFKNKGISINHPDTFIPIQERPLSIFAYLAAKNKIHNDVVEMSLSQIVTSIDELHRLHLVYSRLVMGDLSKAEPKYRDMNLREFEKNDDWAKWDYWNRNGETQKGSFAVKRTQLVEQLRSGLSRSDLGASIQTEQLFYFQKVGNKTILGLNMVPIPPEKIQWVGLDAGFWDEFISEEE